MASDFLEMAGFDVRFLGANVPTGHLVRMVREQTPDLLALSVTMSYHLPALRSAVEKVRSATPRLRIAVGGLGFSWATGVENDLNVSFRGRDASWSPPPAKPSESDPHGIPQPPARGEIRSARHSLCRVDVPGPLLGGALRSRADRRKDEFLAMLAHELRNPLAAIMTAIGILERKHTDDAKETRMRSIIHRQTHHLARLVDDLLDISRITRGKVELRRERVDLCALLQQVLSLMHPVAEGRGLLLKGTLPGKPLWLSADTTRLEQVFTNLVDNAIKYTDAGGSISVHAFQEGVDGSARAVVRFTDTGIGIPAYKLPSIFELFSQVDESLERTRGGLGIGLTLVRTLVELHGGVVLATSAGAGKGSEFVVKLPMTASLPALARAPLILDDRRVSAASSWWRTTQTRARRSRTCWSCGGTRWRWRRTAWAEWPWPCSANRSWRWWTSACRDWMATAWPRSSGHGWARTSGWWPSPATGSRGPAPGDPGGLRPPPGQAREAGRAGPAPHGPLGAGALSAAAAPWPPARAA